MAKRGFFGKISSWFRGEGPGIDQHDGPDPDGQDRQAAVTSVQPTAKRQPLERLESGFNALVLQLEGINENLSRQASQNAELMTQIKRLPEMLGRFPEAVENQKQLTERLSEQIQAGNNRQEQFMASVDRIPAETARQTEALENINSQLSVAATTEAQMAEGFNRFNETLDKLNSSTVGQTDSIMQMSKTFATSDRYLKYIVSRQNKRYMWLLVLTAGFGLLVVLILTGIIIYLKG